MRPLTFVCLISLIGLGQITDAQPPLPGTQVAQHYQHPDKPEQQLDYLLWLPEEYGQSDKRWPVVMFLHGSGERGDNLALVQTHGPPKLAASHNFPFILVSPQCPKEIRWNEEPVYSSLKGLLAEVEQRYSVDPKKVTLTGLSMGGQGTWFWASQKPYRFAGIVVVCGKNEAVWGEKLGHLPIKVFHGAKDKAVELADSEAIVETIRQAGGDPKLTIYPEAKHDSWTETYAKPALYEWMISLERQPEPPKDPEPLVAPKPE